MGKNKLIFSNNRSNNKKIGKTTVKGRNNKDYVERALDIEQKNTINWGALIVGFLIVILGIGIAILRFDEGILSPQVYFKGVGSFKGGFGAFLLICGVILIILSKRESDVTLEDTNE